MKPEAADGSVLAGCRIGMPLASVEYVRLAPVKTPLDPATAAAIPAALVCVKPLGADS